MKTKKTVMEARSEAYYWNESSVGKRKNYK